jgi:hypothetical protein
MAVRIARRRARVPDGDDGGRHDQLGRAGRARFAADVTAAHRASRFTDVESAVSCGLAEAASSTAAAAQVVEALGVKMGWPVAEMWLADEHRQLLHCAARHVERGRHLGRFALK